MKGMTSLYKEFKIDLHRRRKSLAPLQLVGRLEDYFTKEFARFVFKKSKMMVLPLSQIGNAGDRQKFDLVLTEGDLSESLDKRSAVKPKVRVFIEAKYVRNRHKMGFNTAADESSTCFKSLRTQLGQVEPDVYAGYPVDPRSPKREVYGLVFASFIRREHEEDDMLDLFLRQTVACAKENGLQSFNFKAPALSMVYENVPVTVLNGEFRVSLYAGLWRIKEAAENTPAAAMAAVAR
jgi:hypothetical protein